MTELDLKKLNRAELLEMLIDVTRENDELRLELEEKKRQLADRILAMESTGSIAEASLQLNDVFTSAQAAAEQYLVTVRQQEQRCRDIELDAASRAEMLLFEAEKRAEAIEQQAKAKAENYWNEVSARLEKFYADHRGLKEMLEIVSGKKYGK